MLSANMTNHTDYTAVDASFKHCTVVYKCTVQLSKVINFILVKMYNN